MKVRLDDVIDGEYRPRRRGGGERKFRDEQTEWDRDSRKKKQKPWQNTPHKKKR